MSSIRQHYPAGFDESFEKATATFDSTQELLAIDFVRNFNKDFGSDKFYRYSVADPGSEQPLLMAEYKIGKVWLVVGYLELARPLNLPRWEKK